MIMIYYDICEIRLMEEILHQLIGSLSHYLQCFYTFQVVVSDFFHQLYTTLCPASEDTNDQRLFRTDPPATLEPS